METRATTQTRTFTFNGKLTRATKLYSSGLGVDFTLVERDTSGKETYTPLFEEHVQKDPSLVPIYSACLKAFDDHTTYAKYQGSSSFWQSGGAPGGGGVSE